MKRKIFITLLIIYSSITVLIFAILTATEKNKTTEGYMDLPIETTIPKADVDEIPEKFDLRETLDIIVENQEDYGNCWAFASMTALETNLALHGYGNYDFSELHLDYISANWSDTDDVELHKGGKFDNFIDYVRYKQGPVFETEVPYNAVYTEDDYNYLLGLEQQAYICESIYFSSLEKENEKIYSSNELGEYIELSNNDMELYRDTIKKHIMKNGSIFAGVSADYKIYNEIEETFFPWFIDGVFNEEYAQTLISECGDNQNDIEKTKQEIEKQKRIYKLLSNDSYIQSLKSTNYVATFCPTDTEFEQIQEHHAISIIGWDDNFPKEYFYALDYKNEKIIRPVNNGAYIALNSKGKDFGNNGIYYISYEDKWVESELYGIVSATTNFEEIPKTEIKFEDKNLYNALRERFASELFEYNDTKKSITLSNMTISNTTNLALNGKNISNLFGLENFKKLKFLELQHNNITEICVLNELLELEFLDCSYNNLSIFSRNGVLAVLPKLGSLVLEGNNISDISFLSELIEKCPNLNWIDLSNNDITDISGIPINITYNFSGNKIMNIPESLIDKLYYLIDDISYQSTAIQHNIIESNRLPLPNIFSYTFETLDDTIIETENCEIDFNTKEILLDTSKGENGVAIIRVQKEDGGYFAGSTYTIKL